jgi:hypothetical protein
VSEACHLALRFDLDRLLVNEIGKALQRHRPFNGTTDSEISKSANA